MFLWALLRVWWSRPSARDRILSVLLEAERGSSLGVLGRTIGQRAHIGASTLYTRLHWLEKDGLVTHTVGLPAVVLGNLSRNYYMLTDQGREAAVTSASASASAPGSA